MTADNLIAWLERRLAFADRYTLPIYVFQFKEMWAKEFGSLDGIPQELKDRTTAMYERMKGASDDDPRT